MEIKIFEKTFKYELEKEINDFLKTNKRKVIDIKYAGNANFGQYSYFSYSAMIILE